MRRAEAEQLVMLALDLHDELQTAELDAEKHAAIWHRLTDLLQFAQLHLDEAKD